MDALSVLALAAQCATAAPAPVVAALAIAETNGAVYAVNVAGARSDAGNFDGAVQTVASALVEDRPVRLGLAGVSAGAFANRDLPYTEAFSPCRNLEIAAKDLREGWERFGALEEHWRLAVLEFGTGEPGVEGPFAQRYDAAFTEVSALIDELPGEARAAASKPASRPKTEQPAAPSDTAPSESTGQNWDVYGREQSRSLLIYSR